MIAEMPCSGKCARARLSVGQSRMLVITVCVAALLVAAWWVGSTLIEPTNHAVVMPADFPAQRVTIPGAGHEIAGSWVDRGDASPVVLLLHAVRADRATMAPRARLLVQHGFSALLIDLQGHGETPGTAITLGARESADVTAALSWIRRTAPGRRVGIIGCSLGGAALLLAAQPVGVDAVVLEGVYPRIERAVENRVRLRVGPLAPLLALLLIVQLKPRLKVAASDLQPIESIARVGAPVLVAAGDRDVHTTLAESQDLYEAASEPKELWIVRGAEHEDLYAFDARAYEQHVLTFLVNRLQVGGERGAL
jgi:uncharacterized protein